MSHFSLSFENISARDRLWLSWIELHGASDDSIRRFLELHPPASEQDTLSQSERMAQFGEGEL